METLIIGCMPDYDTDKMTKAAKNRGWKVINIPRYTKSFTQAVLSDSNPVVYAAPGMAESLAKALNKKLVQADPHWLTSLPQEFLKREIKLENGPPYLKGIDYPKFIKPTMYKFFKAAVYDSYPQGLKIDISSGRDFYIGSIYISEPVYWEVEYRCFVANGELKTLAPYNRDMKVDKLTEDDEEKQECAKLIERLKDLGKLPKTGALDIGKIKDRGWAVVELNGAYGSGVYRLSDPGPGCA